MNKKIITILITLILLGVVVFVYVSNGKSAPAPEGALFLPPTPPNTLAPAPLPPATFPDNTLDTSDWQTYHNEEFGFEVRYPSGWKVKIKPLASNIEPEGLSLFFARRVHPDHVISNHNIIEGSVAILGISKGNLIERMLQHGGDKEVLNINNMTVYKLSKNPPSYPYINWYFEKESFVYNFVETDATQDEDVPILQNIIHSFMFTD